MNQLSPNQMLLRMMDKLESLDSKTTEHIGYTSARLEAILEQAQKTNGRVTKHDDRLDKIERKQENMATKVGVGVFLVSAIVSAFINRIL